jgi:hypothetical protein
MREDIFEALEWEALPRPSGESDDGVPYATHRGVITIMGAELECFQLSSGQRVFSAESLERFLGLR